MGVSYFSLAAFSREVADARCLFSCFDDVTLERIICCSLNPYAARSSSPTSIVRKRLRGNNPAS